MSVFVASRERDWALNRPHAVAGSATVVWRGPGTTPARRTEPNERTGDCMLTVTENAATAIRDITSQDVVPDGSGLRISADEGGTALTLSLVAKPFDGDQVVSSAGARLFLDRLAAQLLDDKELDVTVDPSGDVQFAVGDQFDYGVSEDF